MENLFSVNGSNSYHSVLVHWLNKFTESPLKAKVKVGNAQLCQYFSRPFFSATPLCG